MRHQTIISLLQKGLPILLALAGMSPAFQSATAATSPSLAKPNIVFILADDMGIGDCSAYNPASKIATPNIDQLAKEGLRFTDAHAAASICVPSRYGLLTGQYACRTWKRFPPEFPHLHDPNQVTIASVLKKGGYDTAGIGKWHLGMQEMKGGKVRYSPVEVGFDSFFGMEQSLDTEPYYYVDGKTMVAAPTGHTDGQKGDPAKVSNPMIQGAMWREGAIAPGFVHEECLPLMGAKGIEYIKKRPATGAPFFLYLALPAPHAPWLPKAQFRGKSGAGDYGDYMMEVDDIVGQVLAALKQQALSENTLVMFSSDNGPLWFPGDVKHYGHSAAGPWRGWKGQFYEGGHREPFIARWPGKIAAGTTSDYLIDFTDVLATFAELAGVEMPKDAGPDSFSFLPAMLGKAQGSGQERVDMISEDHGGARVALRQGEWKLGLPVKTYKILNGTINPATIINLDKLELYNLKNDPGEKENLVTKNPAKATALFEALIANIQKGSSR